MAEQVIMDDLHIHGGVIQEVVCMGDVYMHGGVVQTMTVQGDCTQNGGIINRRIQQTGAQATYQQQEPKVVYRDRVVYKDRVVYRDRPADPQISSLQAYNRRLSNDLRWATEKIEELKAKIANQSEQKEKDHPCDDVLIQRINHLKGELDKEREAHRKEVEELEWRLSAITDIANGRNERIYEDETNGHYIGVTDDSLDVLFTLINDYPINCDRDLAEEYGISESTLKYIAKVLRLVKSPKERREARERLQRHGSDLIERRGGDQTKGKKKPKTKKKK